jgi:hypothetical protein
MAALFAWLWLSRSVTDPLGLTVAKPSRTPIRRGWLVSRNWLWVRAYRLLLGALLVL